MSEIMPDYRILSDLNLEKLDQILKNKPDDTSLLFALGELALRRGRNLIALSAFTRLLELSPKLAEVHVALAKIFAEQKIFEEAFREIAETLEMDAGNVEARVLYEIFSGGKAPPSALAARIQKGFKSSLDSQKVRAYLRQLGVERDLLLADEREISKQLATSPDETLLEYNRAVVERKLSQNEHFFSKVEELSGIGRPHSSGTKKRESKAEPSLVQPQSVRDKDALRDLRVRVIMSLAQSLDPYFQKIARMKGIAAVILTGMTGEIHHAVSEEPVPSAEVMKTLSGSLGMAWNFAPELAFWVMEFEHGLVVLQTLAPKLFLLILTDATVTFGALRYTLDKNLPVIRNAIRDLEVSVLEH